MFKKLLASTLTALVLFMSVAPSFSTTKAVWYDQSPIEFYRIVHDDSTPPQEIFGERYTYAQVNWIIVSFFSWLPTQLIGPEGVICLMEALPIFGAGGTELDVCFSAILSQAESSMHYANKTLGPDGSEHNKGTLASMADFFKQDREISGITSTRRSFAKLNPTQTVNAQSAGFGYESAIDGFPSLAWGFSRNVAYSLFIFLAIILAFMIMFRVKLSPQTVISIQSSIPKLFITLILITFSFSIAGFLIDLMYVAIGLIALILEPMLQSVGGSTPGSMFDILTKGLFGTGIFGFMIWNLITMPIVFLFSLVALLGDLLGSALFTAGVVGLFLGLGPILFIIISIIGIVLFIMLFILYIRIIKTMIKTYANIILLVIFAPIQIAFGVISSGIGFSMWVKSLVSELAVFPVIGVFFTLNYIFLLAAFNEAGDTLIPFGESLGISLTGNSRFLIGDGWPPLLGASAGNPAPLILFFISFTILSMIPRTADIIKGMISGRMFPIGTALGEATAFPAAVGGFAGAAFTGTAQKAAQGYLGGAIGETATGAWSAIQAARQTRQINNRIGSSSGITSASGSPGRSQRPGGATRRLG